MLSGFRKIAKSWFAPVLFGLIIVSMGSFAMGQYRDQISAGFSDNVITSKGRNVSSTEFKDMYARAKQQAEQQAGQTITPDMAVQAGFDAQVLNSAAQDTALSGFIRGLHIQPSEKLFMDQLKQYPAFFDKVTGKFDQATYQSLLGQNGITPANFKRDTLDNLALNNLGSAAQMSVRAPLTYVSMVSALLQEKRDFSYFELNEKSVPTPATPTDQQLNDFIKTSAITQPEYRTLDVVRFSAAEIAKAGGLAIDPAKLQQRFDFEKDALNKPETRNYVIVPVKDAAQGADVAARLNKGEDPAAVAKSIGKEPVTNTNKPKTAITDKALAEAVFSTPTGKAAAPVTTALGLQVAKVTGITAGKQVTLAELRPQLEAELAADAAKQRSYDQSEAYSKAKAGGATMEAAAAAAGGKVEHYGPLNDSGATLDNKPANLDPTVLKRAFALKQGEEEADVVDMGNGEYSVIRATKVAPKHTPTIDEVRADVTRVYMQTKLGEAVQAKAKELADRWRKGESGEKLAAEAGSTLKKETGLNQEGAQSNQALAPILGAVFNTKLGDVATAPQTASITLIKVEALNMPDTATLTEYAMQQRTTIQSQIFQDLGSSLQKGVVTEMKVKTDIDKARLAMGMDINTVKKLSPKAKGAAPAAAAPASALAK